MPECQLMEQLHQHSYDQLPCIGSTLLPVIGFSMQEYEEMFKAASNLHQTQADLRCAENDAAEQMLRAEQRLMTETKSAAQERREVHRAVHKEVQDTKQRSEAAILEAQQHTQAAEQAAKRTLTRIRSRRSGAKQGDNEADLFKPQVGVGQHLQ